ncbi:MAG: hypothetical protein ACYTFG_22540 [Planctomycetota bacterium]
MDEKTVLEGVWELWTTGRRGEIAGFIEGGGDTTDVLKRYLGLQGELYWEKKDLKAVLSITGFARTYAVLGGSLEAENVVLFNTASFTLPWWRDSLDTTPWQREQGLHAAQKLVAMRHDLGKGPADLSKGHWVLGAHEFFRGNAVSAVGSFNVALTHAREGGDKNLEATALEGLGRTRVRLIPKERDWGFESLGEARALYAEAGDKYNLSELEHFLGDIPN